MAKRFTLLIRCHASYIIRVMKPVLLGDSVSVAVKRDAELRDFAWVRSAMSRCAHHEKLVASVFTLLGSTIWESGQKVKAWYHDGK